MHLTFRYVNGYFEEIHENKYLTLVPTSESKEKIKRSINKNLDDYGYKYMKIKFNSDDELPLNKSIKILP